MTTTSILSVIAGAFGVGMGASPLLQAYRAHRRRSSLDVSLPFLVVLLAGGAAWLSYGVALANAALIIGNSVGVLSSAAAIVVTLRWREKRRTTHRDTTAQADSGPSGQEAATKRS